MSPLSNDYSVNSRSARNRRGGWRFEWFAPGDAERVCSGSSFVTGQFCSPVGFEVLSNQTGVTQRKAVNRRQNSREESAKI
jgi:hypothetical protein